MHIHSCKYNISQFISQLVAGDSERYEIFSTVTSVAEQLMLCRKLRFKLSRVYVKLIRW